MPDVHPRGRGHGIPALAGETQYRQVGHAYVHGHVAEPGKKHHVPYCELHLARQGPSTLPDIVLCQLPDVSERANIGIRGDNELSQTDESESKEDQNHPGRGHVGELGHGRIAVGCNDGNQSSDARYGYDPSDAVGIEVVESRHLELDPDADGRRRDGDHCPGEKAEHHAVGEIIERHELSPAYFFQLVIERQTLARGNGCAQEHPA